MFVKTVLTVVKTTVSTVRTVKTVAVITQSIKQSMVYLLTQLK